ncbi:hypothetical protein Dxin01_03046 [Deinococcus xinjiangensis]|uniref:Uncharacterized protein n=1 Tax=Deinococcus xinjiangensis TaxID=457454 RepID=A0ABP9VEZ5_9DEIO
MEFLGHVSHFVENGGYATAELKVSAPNMMAVVSMD